MNVIIRYIVVRGRVQGVGYRAFIEDEAAIRGLEGWVRNRSDGAVEAVFAGPADEVAMMIEACGKGPHSARVEKIDEKEGTSQQLALRRITEKFSVLSTI